jgi:hypothetical protein
MIRAIALSLALLIGIGAIVPLATDYAEAGSRKYRKGKKYKKVKRYKKYSKGWWRQYRARQKRKRALAARRRALRLRQIRLARARRAEGNGDRTRVVAVKKPVETAAPALLPSGAPAPQGWVSDQVSANELQFRVADGAGSTLGSASISVVGSASGDTVDTGRNRAVGGVPTTSLRREVINRMIRENGWVVNDYQKEIGGQKVYVVVAQSQAGSGVQSRMFYFTEVEGRIYSVATNAPTNNAERLAEESEKVINSLQTRVRPTQQAALKEE